MAHLKLKSISRLSLDGVFSDFRRGANSPSFKERNLIYGFNGSGKTTLSRVLACLDTGEREEALSPGSFEIEFEDGTKITNEAHLDKIKGKIAVFNQDYISRVIHWESGTAEAIFYLSKEQGDAARDLEEATAAQDLENGNKARLLEDRSKAERKFNSFKTELARKISEELSIVRAYNARSLEQDYAALKPGDAASAVLQGPELKKVTQLIAQDQALDKIRDLEWNTDFKGVYEQVESLIKKDIGTVVGSLSDHPSMIAWARTGADYHLSLELEDCLFCGNHLDPARVQEISDVLGAVLDRFNEDVLSARKPMDEIEALLENIEKRLPSENDLHASVRDDFRAQKNDLLEAIADARSFVASLRAAINQKAEAPNRSFELSETMSPWDETREKKRRSSTASLRTIYSEHNRIVGQFTLERDKAIKRYKAHLLVTEQARFEELKADHESAIEGVDLNAKRLVELGEKIKELNRQIRESGPAAEKLNRLLTAYLGHRELQVELRDDKEGYSIQRNGSAIRGDLSEGEKTALALCYFVLSLDSRDNDLKDLIVVLDDPISSLDSRVAGYAVGLISSTLFASAQLFVMTHNLHFMNEMKKAMRSVQGHGSHTLMSVEVKVSEDGTSRKSEILGMPLLLANYDSEYEYLFDTVLRYVSDPESNSGIGYLMPNVTRRVLEIYTGFKMPHLGNVGARLIKMCADKTEIDPAKLAMMQRVADMESHGNTDGLVSLSTMTIEEGLEAAKALITLVKTTDPDHFDGLRALSDRHGGARFA